MINSALKLLAALLSVLLLFIFPLSDSLKHQEDLTYLSVTRSVSVFADSVRDRGYVSPTMYNEFVNQLAMTGNEYEVRMEHYEKRYEPIYKDPVKHDSFQNDFLLRYQVTVHEDMMITLFPKDYSVQSDDARRRYQMQAGDYFSVDIRRMDQSIAVLMQHWLLGISAGRQEEVITAGGMVRNEAN